MKKEDLQINVGSGRVMHELEMTTTFIRNHGPSLRCRAGDPWIVDPCVEDFDCADVEFIQTRQEGALSGQRVSAVVRFHEPHPTEPCLITTELELSLKARQMLDDGMYEQLHREFVRERDRSFNPDLVSRVTSSVYEVTVQYDAGRSMFRCMPGQLRYRARPVHETEFDAVCVTRSYVSLQGRKPSLEEFTIGLYAGGDDEVFGADYTTKDDKAFFDRLCACSEPEEWLALIGSEKDPYKEEY